MALPICCNSSKRLLTKLKFLRTIFKERYLSKDAKCSPARVFSGIQPTGVPHIGNYLGAIQNWVRLQNQYDDVIYTIVDLHSITVPKDPKVLRENIYTLAACLIACGINPEKSILFQQSSVPQHTELAWILMCHCSLNKLQQLPEWKEKKKKSKQPTVGLLNYPVLQAADILLYKSTVIPVGQDQLKHIELARDLAKLFNTTYIELFPIPECLIGNTQRIKSLRDPTSKMSKSDTSELSHVNITDSPDVIREKFKKAMSDFTSEVTYDPENRAAIANLIDIYSAFTDKSPEEVCEDCKELDTLAFKLRLADIVIEKFEPISKEVNLLLSDKGHLDNILYMGYERATAIAEKTLKETKKLVGFS